LEAVAAATWFWRPRQNELFFLSVARRILDMRVDHEKH